jgi:predicted RNA-binding Zn-ribbon protein involved in translation (DUF1610 family)
MALAHCSNCGHEVDDLVRAPCPRCGDTRITVSAVGNINACIGDCTWELAASRRGIKKNRPFIAVLALGDLISTIPAYFLSGWASVAVTLLFIVASTVVGYYAITRVVRITTRE